MGYLAAGKPAWLYDAAEIYAYNGAILLPGIACLVRASASRVLRGAWIALGVGLVSWALADLYWTLAFEGVDKIPYPSWADVGYLAALPCFYVGVVLLVSGRIGNLNAASWLDGAIAALAAAAFGTAVLAPTLVGLTRGDTAAVITNMAYPLGDLLLIALLVGALIVGGIRNAGAILTLLAGLLVWGISDSYYLYAEATSSYSVGWLDNGWLVGALLIGAAALFPAPDRPMRGPAYRASSLAPSIFASIAIGVMIWDQFESVNAISVWLAAATLVLVLVRLAASARENVRLMNTLHSDAVTDPLTGLGNRRQMFSHLERLLDAPGPGNRVFALFDLDGFKAYNDSFGHPAGDALLRRLGRSLQSVVRSDGAAYRLGGDEFCVLVDPGDRPMAAVVEGARAALTARGDGFAIGASGGVVQLPREAASASGALRLADNRMYAEKGARPGRVDRQTHDLLTRILREREPTVSDHQTRVVSLAARLARELELSAEDVDVVMRAAEFHDIGKIAIPDEILTKPGPLDELEWELVRKHTLIGERILGVSPALAPVARVVRSSHERWDGHGYPDGTAGAHIPLASRIIFVCDAFDAMRSERVYSPSKSVADAIAEIRADAGAKFDPRIAEMFCRLVEERQAASAPSGPADGEI